MKFKFCYTQVYDAEEMTPTMCTQTIWHHNSQRQCLQWNSEGDKLRIVLFWKISLLYHAISKAK